MTFSIPMSQPVSNVFPLPEGLLIETKALNPTTNKSLKQELLSKSEDTKALEDFKFSYFSLNFHPLNQLYSVKVLKEEGENEEEFRRESISKGLGFGSQANVFSSGGISSEFVSDSQFINSNVIVFQV